MAITGLTPAYRAVMTVAYPVVKIWGRLEVDGLDLIPATGPVLLIGNHDSYWDPVVFGVAGMRRRQVQALAKAELWKNKFVGAIVSGMAQIPVYRGEGNAEALSKATELLRDGACIGVFPEGTISRGVQQRPRSGAAWLAREVPEAEVLLVRLTGTVDIVRFPKRPKIRVTVFKPAGGGVQPGEEPAAAAARWIAELRSEAPVVIPGRNETANRIRERIAQGLPPKG